KGIPQQAGFPCSCPEDSRRTTLLSGSVSSTPARADQPTIRTDQSRRPARQVCRRTFPSAAKTNPDDLASSRETSRGAADCQPTDVAVRRDSARYRKKSSFSFGALPQRDFDNPLTNPGAKLGLTK